MFLLHRREAGSEETMETEMVVGIIDWFLEEVSSVLSEGTGTVRENVDWTRTSPEEKRLQ